MKAPKPFATEAALCAMFLDAVAARSGRGSTWTPYAETAGHDILLVRNGDGFQIGIQAKLKLGLEVINQALADFYSSGREGPDCRAVLVPDGEARHLDRICEFVGLTIIRVDAGGDPRRYKPVYQPDLPDESHDYFAERDWFELCPLKRHALPEYVPDVAAGASAPLQLTSWKIKALKIAVTLELRGFVTREDFKHIGLDARRWIDADTGWLDIDGHGRLVAGRRMPPFKVQHPRVFGEIKARAPEWMLSVLFDPAKQLNLAGPA